MIYQWRTSKTGNLKTIKAEYKLKTTQLQNDPQIVSTAIIDRLQNDFDVAFVKNNTNHTTVTDIDRFNLSKIDDVKAIFVLKGELPRHEKNV